MKRKVKQDSHTGRKHSGRQKEMIDAVKKGNMRRKERSEFANTEQLFPEQTPWDRHSGRVIVGFFALLFVISLIFTFS
jgi:hypothetical protein